MTASAPPPARGTDLAGGHHQAGAASWLLLIVDGIEYGLSLEHVREIRRAGAVTPVPAVPSFVDGVMNLRGRIVPVVDLRARFGLPRVAHDRFTVVVVIESSGRTCGLVADAVRDVVEVPPEHIGPPPAAVPGEGAAFVQGLAERDETLTILLDAEALMVETEPNTGASAPRD